MLALQVLATDEGGGQYEVELPDKAATVFGVGQAIDPKALPKGWRVLPLKPPSKPRKSRAKTPRQ